MLIFTKYVRFNIFKARGDKYEKLHLTIALSFIILLDIIKKKGGIHSCRKQN